MPCKNGKRARIVAAQRADPLEGPRFLVFSFLSLPCWSLKGRGIFLFICCLLLGSFLQSGFQVLEEGIYRVAAGLQMESQGTLNPPGKQAQQTSITCSFNLTNWQGTVPSAPLALLGSQQSRQSWNCLGLTSRACSSGNVICVTANQIHSSAIIRHWAPASFGALNTLAIFL